MIVPHIHREHIQVYEYGCLINSKNKHSDIFAIGLYISKKIIEAHGGKIWGKNKDYNGIGAEFGFILPIE